MTSEALKAKLESSAPPPRYEAYPLLNSPEFNELVTEKATLDIQKKVAEERLKEIGPEIEAMLMGAGVDAVGWGEGFTVKIGRGRAADKIVPTRLLEAGVTVEQIAAATEEGKPYTFAQIVTPKVKK